MAKIVELRTRARQPKSGHPAASLAVTGELCDDVAMKRIVDEWLVPRLVDQWLANDEPAVQPNQPEDNGNP